jgi:hypothetical protein
MIERIIQRQTDNGGQFWSRADGDIHAPFGFSTIDTLSVTPIARTRWRG